MTRPQIGLIVAFICCFAILTSCSDSGSSNSASTAANTNKAVSSNSAPAAKTNVEELALLINIPYESEDASWKEDAARKRIIAVFRFNPVETAKVIGDAEKIRPPEGVSVASESWFPPELIAQSEMSGDDTLKAQSYAANAFFNAPYDDGRIARIEGTDYFVLELSAK